jgi:hypothetical protein
MIVNLYFQDYVTDTRKSKVVLDEWNVEGV